MQQAGGGGAPAAGVEIPSGAFVAKITNDAREDEMEDNMKQVGSVLGNLKNMATDMGQEIDRQNKQIDKISAKVGNFSYRMFLRNKKCCLCS